MNPLDLQKLMRDCPDCAARREQILKMFAELKARFPKMQVFIAGKLVDAPPKPPDDKEGA